MNGGLQRLRQRLDPAIGAEHCNIVVGREGHVATLPAIDLGNERLDPAVAVGELRLHSRERGSEVDISGCHSPAPSAGARYPERARMFSAAFTSRSCDAPHSLHVHRLIPWSAIPFGRESGNAPQLEQTWEVKRSSTSS